MPTESRKETVVAMEMVTNRRFWGMSHKKRKKWFGCGNLLIGYVLDTLMTLFLYFCVSLLYLRSEQQRIADIFVKKGPYLKMYSTYIKEFDKNIALLDEQCKKNTGFAAVVREFEVFFCYHLMLNVVFFLFLCF